MNSQVSIEVRAEGAASADFLGSFEGLSHHRKGPQPDGPGMRFAFLIHPLSQQTTDLMALDRDGRLRQTWGRVDLLEFCAEAHAAFRPCHQPSPDGRTVAPRIADTFDGLVSAAGARAQGRLYEIPMDGRGILGDPGRALELMEQAVEDAIGWGARIVGLGSMTGIVGNHGAFLAERQPIAVTTGNSLTVYATVRNLEHYCEDLGIDLADEEIAVVGIPGSIATAVATLLAPRCRRLVLAARQSSSRAIHVATRLGARLEVDLPKAVAESTIVVTATSSGDCIDPGWLRPGCLVLDVGVPSDIRRAASGPRRRPDSLCRICPRARGDAPRLFLPAVLSRDRAFLPGRNDGPGAGEPRRLVLDRARPQPRPRPRDRPTGRGAWVHVLGGARVRSVAEYRGPIPVPQGPLEYSPSAITGDTPMRRCGPPSSGLTPD